MQCCANTRWVASLACAQGRVSVAMGMLSTRLCCVQGVPVREGLQLLYKITRDKTIKEAIVFVAYFGVFMLVIYSVIALRACSHLAFVVLTRALS